MRYLTDVLRHRPAVANIKTKHGSQRRASDRSYPAHELDATKRTHVIGNRWVQRALVIPKVGINAPPALVQPKAIVRITRESDRSKSSAVILIANPPVGTPPLLG